MTPLFFFGFFPGIGGGSSTVNVGATISGMGGLRSGLVVGLTNLAARITGTGRMSAGYVPTANIGARVMGAGQLAPNIGGSVNLSARVSGMGSIRSSFLTNVFLLAARITGMGWLFSQFIQNFSTQPCEVAAYPGPWTHFEIDTLIRFTSAFTTQNAGAAIDPSSVICYVIDPNGVKNTYTGAQIIRDSIGDYHIDLTLTVSGRWIYKWQGTGIATVTSPDIIIVVNQSSEIAG